VSSRVDAPHRARAVLDSVERLVGGLGTAMLALVALVLLAVTVLACLVGVGLLMLPASLQLVRAVADRERTRLSRWGPELVAPGPVPHRLRAALTDRSVRREVGWLVGYPPLGLALGLLGLGMPIDAVRDLTFPLWWQLVPRAYATSSLGWPTVHGWPNAIAVALIGVGWGVVVVGLGPALSRLQAWPGRRLLAPDPHGDMSLRISQLTTTRAAALDAHAMELRRIERSLHDGAQNRLVAVTVLVGAARRAAVRDPAAAVAALDRAQTAAEQALAELRAVARSILPPVLADRGLAGALSGLAAAGSVPCRIEVDVPGRCAASVEATAYFVVAEALTNVAKHSRARHATLTVRRRGDRLLLRVTDDGCGGAAEDSGTGLSGTGLSGTGLSGIRRRVEAHDGSLTMTSPPGGPTTMEVDLPCGS
jgi:signal transduction histidine kinase